MEHNVYQAYFKRKGAPEQPHVALFVRSGPHPTKHEGEIFHVIEDREVTNDEIVKLIFDNKTGILEEHRSFSEAVHIGKVSQSKVQSLRSICENMPSVVALQTTWKPDCVTWLDNVVHELNKNKVVTFQRDFSVPSGKKPLQVNITSYTSKDKGSSSSSKDKSSSPSSKVRGSPSSSKDKGSSSPNKGNGSSSVSKQKGSSSSSKAKGSSKK